MNHWNTDALVAGLEAAFAELDVHTLPFGGDYDTNTLLLVPEGGDPEDWNEDALLIAGFVVNQPGYQRSDPDDMDVDIVEFRNRMSDDRGGIQTDDMEFEMLAVRVKHWLRGQGFTVVDTIDGFY